MTSVESGAPSLPGLGVKDEFGIGAILSQGVADLDAATNELRRFSSTKVASATAPFYFDSKRLCISAYQVALGQVRERFWATTFLSSGFWAEEDENILTANLRLMDVLKQGEVVTRRLFLIPLSLEEEVRRWQDERISLLKCEDVEGLSRFDDRLANLFRNIETLATRGCDLRVVYDRDELHTRLPSAIRFDHRDSELALYDDWRFDVFSGGRAGAIAGVSCFTPVMEQFEEYRDQMVAYFEALWSTAQPISVLAHRIHDTIERSAARINYQPVWLARYDYGLPEEDKLLKVVELSAVKTQLKQLNRWGRIRRYLDVGTCTGRYPINLRQAVAPDGDIIGIDNDVDCVRFARWNVDQECRGDTRIRIEHRDFCADELDPKGPFALITCMLGTLLHFAAEHNGGPPYTDPLQRALERFAALLSGDGVLFLSVWSKNVSDGLGVLSIYSEEDKQRLVAWTSTRDELQSRLRAAGLEFGPPLELEDRMDLYCCWSRASGRKSPDVPTVAEELLERLNA